MNASDILQRVKETYATLRSYSDRGSATTKMDLSGMLKNLGLHQHDLDRMQRETPGVSPDLSTTQLEFATYFNHPNFFRFEWRDWHPFFGKSIPPNESVLCSNGKTTYFKFLDSVEITKLCMAVAGATGVSTGSILLISKLLMPDYIESDCDWFEMVDARVQNNIEIDGSHCFHIVGAIHQKNDYEAFITTDDLIVRRICNRIELSEEDAERLEEEATKVLGEAGMENPGVPPIGSMVYETVYDYTQVSMNEPIDPSMFEAI